MLSFHSIAPVHLTQATEKRQPPKPKPFAMAITHIPSSSAVLEATDGNGSAAIKDHAAEREPGAIIPEGQRDSGIDLSHDELNNKNNAAHGGYPTAGSQAQEQDEAEDQYHDAPTEPISSQEATDRAINAQTGASNAQSSANNMPTQDNAVIRPAPQRGESTTNAIGYRRDPETVIAFLVPLPRPTIQGSAVDIPPKYFLYAPPPPHLVKPRQGKEKAAHKVHRLWQQNVRRAKVNAHNGKRVSLSGAHSAAIRGCIWASARRRADDGGVFLGRIRPDTVVHLVMIHPWSLSAEQAPEEILKTFRAQITANKASSFVKIITKKMGPEPRTLHISPKEIIDGAHGPRGGERRSLEEAEAEVEDANVADVEDANVADEDEQPQRSRKERVRASLGSAKLRSPVATIKKQINQRGRKRHREGRPGADGPDTAGNAAETGTEFTGGDLEHFSEEGQPTEAATVEADVEFFTGHQLGDIPEEGFLDHCMEEQTTAGPSNSGHHGGGVLGGSTDECGSSGDTSQGSENAQKGWRFQLTFYPSPAMNIMSRYVQASCHAANGHAFPSPTAAPTAAGVVESIGWEPEQREVGNADEQLNDQNWQTTDIEADLEFITANVARAWEKQCRKHVRLSNNGRLSGERKPGRFGFLVARLRSRKPSKGKTREGGSEERPLQNQSKGAALKQRLAAIKERCSKKQPEDAESTEPAETLSKRAKAQKVASVMFIPVIFILGVPILIGKGISSGFKKVKGHKTKTDGTTENTEPQQEKTGRRAVLKQRLSERRRSVKRSLSTRGDTKKKSLAERKAKKTSANGGPTNTPVVPSDAGAEGQINAVDASAAETKDTKKQRLGALVLAAPLAAREMLKRRQGKDKPAAATAEDATPKEKTASKLSAAKERTKSLRTKVNKQARLAKFKARLRVLRERRKTKNSEDRPTEEAAADDGSQSKAGKKQGAMLGLIAGCVTLPASKVKQARDKRRKEKAADSVQGAAAMAREEIGTAATVNAPAAPAEETPSPSPSSPSQQDSQAAVQLAPSDPEGPEAARQRFSPPDNGQSEVPVQKPARTEPEPEQPPLSNEDDVNTTAATTASGSRAQVERPAAALKFKPIRDRVSNVKGGIGNGIGNLKAKRRETGQAVELVAAQSERSELETSDSVEIQVEGAAAAAEDERRVAAAADKDAASGGRLKALRENIGSRMAKTEKPDTNAPVKTKKQKQQVHKSGSGFGDRVRWFLYAG